ncbi:putative tetraacyldisaccharide 4'-kinase [Bordetella bronchiseptica Bbr77]|nr:putative tetraacyldisaccharide 4'-kinase [Bordetella bronchiseptica Bbr77]
MNAPRCLRRLLERQWRQGGWLSTLLRPLAALTGLVVARKRNAYLTGARAAWRAPVPVVVVGNIYVGGTGKTPVVIEVVRQLQARGWTPGVVSRGYGVDVGAAPRVGQGQLAAADYGDEPALIARATGAAIAVHPHRPRAVQALLRAHPGVDVVVSDDGLQHLALARDVEIVVQDERGVGNGRLLPAGPLREPAQRLADVDAQRVTDGATRTLADLAALPPARLAAAAGIGNPARFFQTLEQAGIRPAHTLALPDHYAYAQSPFTALDADLILVTAKDAIKCAALDDPRLWAVQVGTRLSDPDFGDWLSATLRARQP